jgi:itaconate CoA-transferase
VPYGPFLAGDGGTIFLSIQNEREFGRFCDTVLGSEALKTDGRFSSGPARLQNREAMHEEIERVFSKLTTEEAIGRLEIADIANARLNSLQEFWDHPQFEARNRWAKVGTPGGEIDALKPPFNIDAFEPRMDAVPALGSHTRAILQELGYLPAQVEQLAAQGAV